MTKVLEYRDIMVAGWDMVERTILPNTTACKNEIERLKGLCDKFHSYSEFKIYGLVLEREEA